MSVINAESAIAGIRATVRSMDDRALDDFATWATGNPSQFRGVVDAVLERPKEFEKLLNVGLPAAGFLRGANAVANHNRVTRFASERANAVLDAAHGAGILNVIPGRLFGMRPNEALGAASAAMRFGREQRPLADQLLKRGVENPEGIRTLGRALSEYGVDLRSFVQDMREKPSMHRAAVTFVDVLGRPHPG